MAIREGIEADGIPPDKCAKGEGDNPYHVIEEENGQKWRVGPDGSKLKIGNPQATGRPKKEVRERFLKLADGSAYAWARRVLQNESIPDDSTVKGRAAEIALAYGLGKSDEVNVLKNADVVKALARVLASAGLDTALSVGITEKLADELGLKE